MSGETFVAADRSFLSLASDPDRYIKCGTRRTSAGSLKLEGQVRYYAGGYAGVEVYDQDTRTLPVTLAHLGESDYQKIVEWRGQIVLFRTTSGEHLYGVYFDVPEFVVYGAEPEDDPNGTHVVDVDLTLERVTYIEAS